MSDMSIYCKAYSVDQIREFGAWTGEQLPDAGYVFVHADYAVTRGAFRDTEILLGEAAPDWVRFCQEKLLFAIPEDVLTSSEIDVTQ